MKYVFLERLFRAFLCGRRRREAPPSASRPPESGVGEPAFATRGKGSNIHPMLEENGRDLYSEMGRRGTEAHVVEAAGLYLPPCG